MQQTIKIFVLFLLFASTLGHAAQEDGLVCGDHYLKGFLYEGIDGELYFELKGDGSPRDFNPVPVSESPKSGVARVEELYFTSKLPNDRTHVIIRTQEDGTRTMTYRYDGGTVTLNCN